MGRLLDIALNYDGGDDNPRPAPRTPRQPPSIYKALESLKGTTKLRDEWADVCLSLAESMGWESVTYKQAHSVRAGEHGWRLFCAKATLSDLRDLVYPTLNDKRVMDRPPSNDQTAPEKDGKWKEIL